jgi:hypothetical protein
MRNRLLCIFAIVVSGALIGAVCGLMGAANSFHGDPISGAIGGAGVGYFLGLFVGLMLWIEGD